MIKIRDIIREIELYAPLSLQESFDNAGVQVGDVNQPATGALLCLDVTEEVVDEAIELGCNLIVFSTGRGAPQGFPFVPVVKITGNERTYRVMNEHMDMCVSGVMSGTQSVADAARELLEEVLAVASGKPSKAERCGYNNSMNIYVTGPVI